MVERVRKILPLLVFVQRDTSAPTVKETCATPTPASTAEAALSKKAMNTNNGLTSASAREALWESCATFLIHV